VEAPTPQAALRTRNRRLAAAALAVLGVLFIVTGLMLFNLPAGQVHPPGVQWLIVALGLGTLMVAMFLGLNLRTWAARGVGLSTVLLVSACAILWYLGNTALVRLDTDDPDVEVVLASIASDGHSRLFFLFPEISVRVPAGQYRVEIHRRADQKIN